MAWIVQEPWELESSTRHKYIFFVIAGNIFIKITVLIHLTGEKSGSFIEN